MAATTVAHTTDYLRMMITPSAIYGEARGRHAIYMLGFAIVTIAYHIWA